MLRPAIVHRLFVTLSLQVVTDQNVLLLTLSATQPLDLGLARLESVVGTPLSESSDDRVQSRQQSVQAARCSHDFLIVALSGVQLLFVDLRRWDLSLSIGKRVDLASEAIDAVPDRPLPNQLSECLMAINRAETLVG